MFGKNPIRNPVFSDGDFLDVQEIFPTIQGEGPYVGTPSIFIRLGGCNLACSFCDTEFESFKKLSLGDIISLVQELSSPNIGLIVITGGEPFRQPIEKLCEELINLNFRIQIETNGTIFRDIHKTVEIVCSPKNTGRGYFRIREDLLARITAVKFIISKTNLLYQNVSDIGQLDYKIPVYIQPMDEYNDEKNKLNMEYAINLTLEHGYRLSVQMHKYIGVK